MNYLRIIFIKVLDIIFENNYHSIIKTNIDKFLAIEQEINNENNPKAILSRLGNAYSKKVQSKAIKQPQDNEKSKEKER